MKGASPRTNVMMAGCAILILFTLVAMPGSLSFAGQEGSSSKAKPKADTRAEKTKKLFDTLDRIDRMLKKGEDREAIAEWERVVAADPDANWSENRAWQLTQAYVRLGQHEKAIAVYKPHYHIATESVEQRADLGEMLIFGKVGASTREKDIAVGSGQCPLCHGFSKNYNLPTPYLNLYGVTKRAKRLIASPQYQQRPKDTKQPEAFPGSGIATNVIEYLAESNVCPSCYVVPGHGSRETGDRESLMPHIHKPPIGLTIDEMVAIDTWLLKNEGEEIPSLGVMRAAYEKFLPENDHPISYVGIELASLYDMKGDLELAIKLLDANYPNMLRYAPDKLTQWRNDPKMFPHLKLRPDIVSRFPKLLHADPRPAK